MKHFLSLRNLEPEAVLKLVNRALEIKKGSKPRNLEGRILGMLFFKKSLRTRVSFEAGIARYGGRAISISVGSDSWDLETREGVVMDGDKSEHIKDAAPVLSRYCDILGVRTAAEIGANNDSLINSFAKYATVPVINLESNLEHPCQALADIATIKEKLPHPKKMVFTWLPQVKATPKATPHSISMVGAFLGLNTTIVHPPGYELDSDYLNYSKEIARSFGGELNIEVVNSGTERDKLFKDADIVYGKSWVSNLKSEEDQKEEFLRYSSFKVDAIPSNSLFMHCLPVRRNLKVSDAVLDSSIIVDQAENRMWAQLAILEDLL
jgi:N-acetylornithine carbamoyltransferase